MHLVVKSQGNSDLAEIPLAGHEACLLTASGHRHQQYEHCQGDDDEDDHDIERRQAAASFQRFSP
jgi:hypothetical protein